ncbi:hypothetical protein V2J09_023784 [Rumex salicifolius]
MKKGAYALIFFFWAFLTIITPTLIQWSAAAAAAAADSHSKENTTAGKESIQSEGLTIARKMMKLTQEIGLKRMRKAPPRLPPPFGVTVTSSSPAPAPKEDEKRKEGEVRVVLLTDQLVFKSRRLFLTGL